MLSEYLYIDNTKDKGRGVFTRKKIAAETIIEISPVIVMNAGERKLLDQTLLHDYIFVWGKNKDQCCMALGYIPVYNHSYEANCEYFMDYDEDTMCIKTVRAVHRNEELTINYNGAWNNSEKVWFDVRE
ncbi:SET domain-containing protein-lysine N-methyltransferase [Agriterribacter sp.]|uniref:SET domain-containing protein-lysine N-methyltransferase n=1 Tax=Agriterribacter sp. TaxID=2821509 RepID=UPI002B822268|nr:SET domain-containing protein-lysine N-methyltransferase [Agriterribacter sp.]HRN58588.1 SET domain-containing protein-lysine N-methyltransferase [Agriterribacter sp.]HRO45463.1 SET domain-containing protein-lysine N-methyltransferase [Agriterribacter sp.]HRQ18880.1 SET domain-containing protein-lysine N-methyltransferase [Agriterribacter sp.]